MGRPRTIRTMIARIDDPKLSAFYNLRNTVTKKSDHKLVREAIVERVKELKLARLQALARFNGPCLKQFEYTICECKQCVGGSK